PAWLSANRRASHFLGAETLDRALVIVLVAAPHIGAGRSPVEHGLESLNVRPQYVVLHIAVAGLGSFALVTVAFDNAPRLLDPVAVGFLGQFQLGQPKLHARLVIGAEILALFERCAG